MGVVVSLINQKGGVGKTSTCHHVSGTLAGAGKRILLVDNDPQASLTQGFFGPEAMRATGFGESVRGVLPPGFRGSARGGHPADGIERVAIVPGSVRLTQFNQLPTDRWAESEYGLREFLAEVRSDYDVILIDNPPNLHLCGWAALTASDGLVVPLQAEDYGAQGIVAVMEAVAAVRERTNPALRLLGLLLTMYDKRLGIHVAYERHLREIYGPDVFECDVSAGQGLHGSGSGTPADVGLQAAVSRGQGHSGGGRGAFSPHRPDGRVRNGKEHHEGWDG